SNGYMLLMHAEDQLMSAEAFRILADEFITLYKRIDEK
ncbi:MAG: PTS lactose/cellobiose transporter subunit IIA, partial [Lachnospiraceae bacterium]